MSRPIELLNPSIADLDKAEELERQQRMKSEDNQGCLNAFKVAELLKAADMPSVTGHKGSSKFTSNLEEQERSRRLAADGTELDGAISNAAIVSGLVKEASTTHVLFSHQGASKFTRGLEEQERERRIADGKEAAIRLQRAHRISDSLRVQGSTIRARLVNRKSIIPPSAQLKWQEGKELLGQAYNKLPTTNEVVNTAVNTANAAVHAVTDKATIAGATSTLSSYFSSIKQSVVDAVHTVQHAYYGDEELHSELSSIWKLEEQERSRRMGEDTSLAKHNARYVSALVLRANFPSFQFHSTKGFSNYMRSIEERERTRRLANKDEWDLREMNAKKVSRLLTMLGWPFIQDAKSERGLGETSILAEQERQRRLTDDLSTFYARYNARKLAALIKESCLPSNSSFAIGHVRKMEEKECVWRTKHSSAAIANAKREAGLIENLGLPFFVGTKQQDKVLSLQELDRLEEQERQFRTNEESLRTSRSNARKVARLISKQTQEKNSDKLFSQLAQQQAQSLSYMISHDTTLLAENERKNRINDKYMQQLARANAYKVSSLIRKANQGNLAASSSIAAPSTFSAPQTARSVAPMAPATILGTSAAPTSDVWGYTKPVATLPTKTVVDSNLVAAPTLAKAAPLPTATAPRSAPISAPTPIPPAPVLAAPAPIVAPAPVLTSTTTAAPFNHASAPTKLVPVDATFIERVRKMQTQELQLADREAQKAAALRSKQRGVFQNYRVNRHEHNAQKHRSLAQRHQEWLAINTPVNPSSIMQGRSAM